MASPLKSMFSALRALGRLKLSIKLEYREPPAPARQSKSPVSKNSCRQESVGWFRNWFTNKTEKAVHFEIIGLDRIRDKFHAHWPLIGEKVHEIVRRIIRKHLKEEDSYKLAPPNNYVIFFYKTSKREAVRRGEAIREDVLKVFFSDRILSEHMDIKVRPVSKSELNALNDRISCDGRVMNDMDSCAAQRPFLVFRASAPETRDGLHKQRPALRFDDNGRALLPEPMQLQFRPIRNIGTEKVSMLRYFCRHKMRDGTMLEEYEVLPEDADDDLILDLDLALLAGIQKVLAQIPDNFPEAVKLLCPVHYKTLENLERNRKYLRRVSAIPLERIAKRVAFEILHMPRALYGPDIEVPLQPLLALSCTILIRSPIDRTDYNGLFNAGVQGITIDLSTLSVALLDPELKQKMRMFVKLATREKLITLAYGVPSQCLFEALRETGFGFVCGDVVERICSFANPAPDFMQDG